MDALPIEHPIRQRSVHDGNYQHVLKRVLDKGIMVDDELKDVADNGFYWMSKPPTVFCTQFVSRIRKRCEMDMHVHVEMAKKLKSDLEHEKQETAKWKNVVEDIRSRIN
jgi:hypothetical protein